MILMRVILCSDFGEAHDCVIELSKCFIKSTKLMGLLPQLENLLPSDAALYSIAIIS